MDGRDAKSRPPGRAPPPPSPPRRGGGQVAAILARVHATKPSRRLADESPLRREHYFLTLYRVLESALFALAVFGPFDAEVLELRHPLAAGITAITYLVGAGILLLTGVRSRAGIRVQAAVGIAIDIFALLVALHALPTLYGGVALLLAVNVGAGAVLLPLRLAMGFAAVAALGVIGEQVLSAFEHASQRGMGESMLVAGSYIAVALLLHLLGRQVVETKELADQRGAEVANLSQLNELIIRRMRTGVLVVDAVNRIQLINEAAWYLLGSPGAEEKDLGTLAPELSRRLYHWRNEGELDSTAYAFAEDVPEVIPRFARLTVTDDLFLIFLDDTSLVSRRAEQLTLATLGRLSASIAHEIRNPLMAISYSAQLLEESPELVETDRRLVEIMRTHCERMNGIVQSILRLARRERARPEPVDLAQWVFDFIDQYKASHQLDQDELKAVTGGRHVYAMVDPQHLYQVVGNLVGNARTYGKLPGEPARVTLVARQASEGSAPLLEIIDRGPGIPPKVAATIFDPFYTTSEHGTGLGLYLARQLCESNQASLDYVAVAGGGSCFRISMARPRGVSLPTAPHAAEAPGSA